MYSSSLPLFRPLFSSIFLCCSPPLWVRIAHSVLIRLLAGQSFDLLWSSAETRDISLSRAPILVLKFTWLIFSGYQEHFAWLKNGGGETLPTQLPFNAKVNEWCYASIHPHTAMASTETSLIFFATSYSLSYSFSFLLIFSSMFLFSSLLSSFCFSSHLYVQDLKVLWKN